MAQQKHNNNKYYDSTFRYIVKCVLTTLSLKK